MAKLHIDCIIIQLKSIHIHTRVVNCSTQLILVEFWYAFSVALINVNRAMLQAIAIC